MKPFNKLARCPICGGAVKMRYCDSRTSDPFCLKEAEDEDAHMHRVCLQCEYEWIEGLPEGAKT